MTASRPSILTLPTLVLCTAAITLAAPPKDKKDAHGKAPSTAKQDPLAAMRALYMELPEVTLDGLPLDEFGEWLARETKVNVVIHWKRLEKEGITRQTEIHLKMKKALVVDVIKGVLSQIGEGHAELGYRTSGSIITISTKSALDAFMVTKTYDVQDLLQEVPDFEAIRPANMARFLSEQNAARRDKTPGVDDSVQQLIDVITSSVFPNSWKVNGGSGTIKAFQGRLIIRNTPEVHDLLRGTLHIKSTDK